MKQVTFDKYTIAWFKLADCISRGEKERAFGIYRLLSHSIDDAALVKQLEGDISLAFNDLDNAIKKYEQAVHLYREQKRILQAVAVYEHLLLLDPNNKHYHIETIDLYTQLAITSKIKKHQEVLLSLLVYTQDLEALAYFMSDFELKNPGYVLHLRQVVVCALLACNYNDDDLIISYLDAIIEQLIIDGNGAAITQFLSKLNSIQSRWYDYLCTYLNNHHTAYKLQ